MNIREAYRHIRALFQQKQSSGFLSKEETLLYLADIELSEGERRILDASFRTRTRIDGSILNFQFRISPSTLTGIEQNTLETISNSLLSKLARSLPEKTIHITIKVSDCCGKGCYGCEKYGK